MRYAIVHTSAPDRPLALPGAGTLVGGSVRLLWHRFTAATGYTRHQRWGRGFRAVRWPAPARP